MPYITYLNLSHIYYIPYMHFSHSLRNILYTIDYILYTSHVLHATATYCILSYFTLYIPIFNTIYTIHTI